MMIGDGNGPVAHPLDPPLTHYIARNAAGSL